MHSTVETSGNVDRHTLEVELKKLGISVVSSRQDTVIAVTIKGLAGRALNRGLHLADQVLQEKITHAIQLHTNHATKLFTDPTFGPCSSDPHGEAAMCKTGPSILAKGASQHHAKVFGLLQRGKIRWERPIYALDNELDNSLEVDEDDHFATDNVFAKHATLFADGVSSGDVIQGNLGDCWFLSALSVVATRFDILEQNFWRKDQFKTRGLFICRFMKNFVWHYVIIDDALPVFGFSHNKTGKPYFARCRNPNELWVSLLEKAYAKLHGSYEALIGGFVDCALNDLTGMCSEQVILKEGFPGYGENPFAPVKPEQKHGEAFWDKINYYKDSGTLMGCSIQLPTKEVAAESSAGNGLYFKHAYALVDAAEITTLNGEAVRLVKLRNPWGMGEWTGPWSDLSDERAVNDDAIAKSFKILSRKVGANAGKRIFVTTFAHGTVGADTISQEEVSEINANDGTFFMSFEAWMQVFTHFFAGIDFPDFWHGRRSEGYWNEANCGGNPTKSTWVNNPHFELGLEQRARIFVSLSQEDLRGSDTCTIVPIGFHICSLCPVSSDPTKLEIREPSRKLDAYYRAYKPADRESYQSGKRMEPLPPAIIPGTVIPGIDDDGVPQPAYTFKQAVSMEATMEPALPEMSNEKDQTDESVHVGSFWISVYSDKPTFRLEGGETIVEEEEGDDEIQSIGQLSDKSSIVACSKRQFTASSAKNTDTIDISCAANNRWRFESAKEELLTQAKRIGIGLRELRATFAKSLKLSRVECRHKLQKLGFSAVSWDDGTLEILFGQFDKGEQGKMISTDRIVQLFAADLQEEQIACELPDIEKDGDEPDNMHCNGILDIELHGASGIAVGKRRQEIQRKVQIPAPAYSSSETCLRQEIALEILERNQAMARQVYQFTTQSALLAKTHPRQRIDGPLRSHMQDPSPVTAFYELLENEYTARLVSRLSIQDDPKYWISDIHPKLSSKRDEISSFYSTRSSSDAPGWTQQLNSPNELELHKSNRLRDLEAKRSVRLKMLLQHKQSALGDAEKTALLPRLIGGKKSGSRHVKCIDCKVQVLVSGRSNWSVIKSKETTTFSCNGSNCVNIFCSSCFSQLPQTSKLCEECFQHEIAPDERFGEQLRGILIEKIGGSDQQRLHLEQVFCSFDADQSGSLSPREFEKMLELLNIQPALTQDQKTSLIEQFDANGDGEISLTEFKHWILRDHVWTETIAPPTCGNAVAPVWDTVIAPLCNDIIELAYDAYAFSSTIESWSCSSSSTIDGPRKTAQKGESGVILLQRVLRLATLSNGKTTAAAKVFDQVDSDASGSMDQFEFVALLSVLGIHFHVEDATLLMNRLGATATGNGRMKVEKAVFIKYVEQMGIKSFLPHCDDSLGSILAKLSECAKTSPAVRESLQDELQQMHCNMTNRELRSMCQTLSMKAGLEVSVDDLKSVAINLAFDYDVDTPNESSLLVQDSVHYRSWSKSSGDFLARELLSESGNLMAYVNTFDAVDVCTKLSTHLQIRSGTLSTDSIWKSVFGADPADFVYLSDFISDVLKTGFRLDVDFTGSDVALNSCLLTALQLSLTLNAVRIDFHVDHLATLKRDNSVVTFHVFQVIMRLQKLREIELQFNHALTNFLQLCTGEQQYLVTIALDAHWNLLIRANDPILKLSANLSLCQDEYDYQSLLVQVGFKDFKRRRQETHRTSREATFTQSPHGLITSECYLKLNASMLAIIERIRIDQECRHVISPSRLNTLSLSLVESNEFISTLRALLSKLALPFFWSVNRCSLVFSIDKDYLDQLNKPNFQQLIADTLSQRSSPSLRALATFVTYTASSLRLRYQIVGKSSSVETSWQEFQDLISGHQNVYAILELHPHNAIFSTCVARLSGSGGVQWNFRTQVKIQEPQICDRRIDRPIIFTDTVKVSSLSESSSSAEHSPFIVGDNHEMSGHYVVVSVRRALFNGSEATKPRLYCTAYDPLTSCDYAVEGYPCDWPVDFFEVAVNPSFESQWQAMLSKMRLGTTITPKLAITVFHKQSKNHQLIGACQVAVGSAIAQEGHNIEKNIAFHSTTSSSAGVLAMTFRFDVNPTADIVQKTLWPDTGAQVPIKYGAQYLAGEIETPRLDHGNNDNTLEELQASVALSELSKRKTQEQVKHLQAQVQQLSNASDKTPVDAAERWKQRLEHARQEQLGSDERHAATLTALQKEICRLSDEIEANKRAPQAAINLKDCKLSAHVSAHEILTAMQGILMSRCPERPYHGLKKALAAEAEGPGKVTFAVLNDILGDFGLALTSEQRATLLNLLDPELTGRVSIEDLFLNLCGDAEAYENVRTPQGQILSLSQPNSPFAVDGDSEPVAVRPTPPPQRQISPLSTPMRGSSGRPEMRWPEMKQCLVQNLPDGWDTRFTAKGRPYFCNHANRSTQWKHPRPEIETIFSNWVQQNGASFNRKATSARAYRHKE